MERYVECFSLQEYSCVALSGIYNSLLILVSHLHNPESHEGFVTACRLMRQTASDFPVARFILQGVRALAWTLKMPLPDAAIPLLKNLGGEKESWRDIPIAFVLPQADAIRELLADDSDGISELGGEMGTLLSKWSALSID